MQTIGPISIGIVIILLIFSWSSIGDLMFDFRQPDIGEEPVTESMPMKENNGMGENTEEENVTPVVSPAPPPTSPHPSKEVMPHFEYVPPSPKLNLSPPSPVLVPAGPVETPKQISSTSTPTSTPKVEKVGAEQEPPKKLSLPPLDEEAILKAVVKIECPTERGTGKFIGSGFLLQRGIIVTAAHVVKDSGSKECTVIFPRARKPIHYLRGVIRDFDGLEERLDEKGIDFALIDLPAITSYPEAQAIFDSYPFVPYPFCEDPKMLGDETYHYGYPANFQDLDYLERLKGEALEYADIKGTKLQASEDGSTYKAPIFSFTLDDSKLYPYMVSRTGVFYGASGGLAFNVTKQCILGPHHGFSSGSSESFSIFMVLGWAPLEAILSR